ncbi:hypothetical protein RHSP_60449 [Rhizobium freirei PRF 81]|uniref:Uncharacterized protein n=1 Tax=Rhizobium freirei PRF 81 TaxID=363754 RepID=N6V6W2_9HYPH|nr:hypothetical protein RHSP_60449 [Rhizobium freirei PRF 81]
MSQKSSGRVRVESRPRVAFFAQGWGLDIAGGVGLHAAQRCQLSGAGDRNGPLGKAVRFGVAGPVDAGVSRWLALGDLSHDTLVDGHAPEIKRKTGPHRRMTRKALTAIVDPRSPARRTSVSGAHLAPETICPTAREPERIARRRRLTALLLAGRSR